MTFIVSSWHLLNEELFKNHQEVHTDLESRFVNVGAVIDGGRNAIRGGVSRSRVAEVGQKRLCREGLGLSFKMVTLWPWL